MRAVIVYESLFGNTREIAEAIGDGIGSADPGARVLCVGVGQAGVDVIQDADLLVVGGPTHMRRMTTPRTRTLGLRDEEKKAKDFHPEPGAAGPGVRDWFAGLLQARPGAVAAAFDTRVASRFAGGAARGIARELERHGYGMAATPVGFIVGGTEGPLGVGERDRARAWGAELCQKVAAPSR